MIHLLTGICFVLGGSPGFIGVRGQTNPFLHIEQGLRCPNLLHVRLVDLEFDLIATSVAVGPDSMLEVQVTTHPSNFFLRNRGDIVPSIEYTLKSSTGRDAAIARLCATWFLPYIDDQAAAALYLSLPVRKLGDWNLGLVPNALPAPVDSTLPRAWTRYVGEEPVLKLINSKLETESGSIPWSLALLGSSGSSSALAELRAYFQRNPGKKALGAIAMIGAERLPRGSWNYLRSEIFPAICKDIGVEDGHWTLLILYGFHLSLERKGTPRIEGFSWGEARPFAEEYLDHLLDNPDFDRIMVGGSFGKVRGSIAPLMMAEACEEYGTLLEVCGSFGVRDQISSLNRALFSYEKVMNDPKMISEWPLGRGGSESGPRYEEALASFRNLKRKAVQSMETRSRSG